MAFDRVEATNTELSGLYEMRATSYLNMLYYGRRASIWSQWNLWLQVGAAVGSLGAVTTLMAVGAHPVWRWIAAAIGAISAACAVLPAIMGHAERVTKFEKLHFAYCELFELTKRTIMEIRRTGMLTDEQIGTVKLLGDLCSRFGKMEDADHKDKIRDACEEMVRKRFPPESLWYASEHASAETTNSSTAP